jgi:hypothetical protein
MPHADRKNRTAAAFLQVSEQIVIPTNGGNLYCVGEAQENTRVISVISKFGHLSGDVPSQKWGSVPLKVLKSHPCLITLSSRTAAQQGIAIANIFLLIFNCLPGGGFNCT